MLKFPCVVPTFYGRVSFTYRKCFTFHCAQERYTTHHICPHTTCFRDESETVGQIGFDVIVNFYLLVFPSVKIKGKETQIQYTLEAGLRSVCTFMCPQFDF